MRLHRTGSKTIHHPVVRELTLSCEAMELSADALALLASWAQRLP